MAPSLPALLTAAALTLAVDPVSTYCAKNFTGTQTQPSISAVLAALVPRASAAYYATAMARSGGSTVWGLAQCRGDIPSPDCARAASPRRRGRRRRRAGARRTRGSGYDDADFLGLPDTGYTLVLINTMNATGDPDAFDRAERQLMARVAVLPGALPMGEGAQRVKDKDSDVVCDQSALVYLLRRLNNWERLGR
jgi:hypothetical protein